MAQGKTRHYGILGIHRRHFVETAELAGLSQRTAISQIEEVIEASPKALHRAISKLPKDFPADIAASIHKGVKGRTAQLANERETVVT
jgi:serine/threonine-protein kinase HipA